jgi:hypothetical protein
MQKADRDSALRFRITLDGIDPAIWREVIFPNNITLHELHRAIQVLFGSNHSPGSQVRQSRPSQ